MKKLLSILTAISVALFISSCGKKEEKPTSPLREVTSSQSSTVTEISLSKMDTQFTDNDKNFSVENSITPESKEGIITINDGNTYKVTGTHSQLVVNAGDNDKPKIILENAEINCENGPAIYIKNADKVFITLPENTQSSLSDGESYDSTYDNADGTVFSKADLTVNGKGKLDIKANYKCGIVSKDDLVIYGTKINVSSAGSAIEGKDCVKLGEAEIDIISQKDGIKATNTEDGTKGFVYLESGNYTITSETDGIQAQTALLIDGGTFNIKTGGGSAISSSKNESGWGNWGRPDMGGFNSQSTQSNTSSAKALKSGFLIKINGGEINCDSSDDSIHSNSDIEINAGTVKLTSGDDGIHADDELIINNGNITVSKSYEGLEATIITLNNGNIDITASDDGLNSAGGNDSSSMNGRPGQNPFESDSESQIYINGGYILINASGDGVDTNGDITVNGGTLLVSGPTNSGNSSLDMGGKALINGGIAIFTGTSGMAESFSGDSKQASVSYVLQNNLNSGEYISITDKSGNVLASFMPSKNYNHIIFSTPSLKKGNDYNICIGGSIPNADKNGFTSSGRITDADDTLEITLSDISTSYGSGGMNGMGGKPDRKPW